MQNEYARVETYAKKKDKKDKKDKKPKKDDKDKKDKKPKKDDKDKKDKKDKEDKGQLNNKDAKKLTDAAVKNEASALIAQGWSKKNAKKLAAQALGASDKKPKKDDKDDKDKKDKKDKKKDKKPKKDDKDDKDKKDKKPKKDDKDKKDKKDKKPKTDDKDKKDKDKAPANKDKDKKAKDAAKKVDAPVVIPPPSTVVIPPGKIVPAPPTSKITPPKTDDDSEDDDSEDEDSEDEDAAETAVKDAAKADPPTDECISVNAFVRAVDAKISAQIATSIPCANFKQFVQDATSTYSNANNSDIIAAISATLQTNVMCHGDVVTNVAELRRSIARVSCTSENGTVRIDELPDSADSPPIPQGFVIPRLWDTTWTPTWAKSNGWIQDPYYDWLMPTQQVPTNGTMPSVTPPPAANPEPAPAPAPTPAPAPAADDSEADDSEAIDWKPYVKWAIGLAVCLVVIIGIYMVWKSIESRRSQREQVGETAVDEAFDNSAPPTDVSLADQDFDAGQGGNNSTEGYNAGQGNNNTVPNTSDLMNDLPSPSRKSRQ